jgi:hypothetical protein
MHTCPVCGYNELSYPPRNFTICPSCYTEFGYDDATLTHADLRREWIENGMPWMGINISPPPLGWNPYKQLTNLSEARETKTPPVTKGAHIEVVDIGEGVTTVQTVPTVFARVRWQIINLAGGVQLAPA